MKREKPESKKVMKREASDNTYLHKDFHLSMNILMKYIFENFGKEQLVKFLEQYAEAYYKPLNQKLKSGDIKVLLDYFTNIYAKEEWPVRITPCENYIEIEQDACPGISHITVKGEDPCPCYNETYLTVYKTLCMNTPFKYELQYFDEKTGACKQIFRRTQFF